MVVVNCELTKGGGPVHVPSPFRLPVSTQGVCCYLPGLGRKKSELSGSRGTGDGRLDGWHSAVVCECRGSSSTIFHVEERRSDASFAVGMKDMRVIDL